MSDCPPPKPKAPADRDRPTPGARYAWTANLPTGVDGPDLFEVTDDELTQAIERHRRRRRQEESD